jgi:signal transduction histidine kinase
MDAKPKNELAATNVALLNVLDDLSAEKNKLEEALTKLWKLNKMEETVLNLGHELKSPLMPIKSQLQLLLDGDFGSINSKQKKSLEMILRNTERLNSLIGNVTDIAKIESDTLTIVYDPISLEKIIREQVYIRKPKCKAAGISLTMKPIKLPIIQADRQRISEVISNLLDNAIKFTPTKGKVIVEAKQVKDSVLVRVIDNGIGVKKEVLNKLFVRFFQADSSISRRYGGTGLGLSICKGIIDAHGGKIWAKSRGIGKGSIFSFTIPIHEVSRGHKTLKSVSNYGTE